MKLNDRAARLGLPLRSLQSLTNQQTLAPHSTFDPAFPRNSSYFLESRPAVSCAPRGKTVFRIGWNGMESAEVAHGIRLLREREGGGPFRNVFEHSFISRVRHSFRTRVRHTFTSRVRGAFRTRVWPPPGGLFPAGEARSWGRAWRRK